jgi:hypothetical protein
MALRQQTCDWDLDDAEVARLHEYLRHHLREDALKVGPDSQSPVRSSRSAHIQLPRVATSG